MKNLYYYLLTLSCLTSCVDNGPEATHQLEYPLSFVIIAGSNPVLTHVNAWQVQSSWQNFLTTNKLTSSQITQVKPRTLRIASVFNTPQNYDYIEEARVKIFDPSKVNFKIPIGEVFFEPKNRDVDFYLVPGLADVKDYVSLDFFNINLDLRYREVIRQNLDQRLILTFDVYTQ